MRHNYISLDARQSQAILTGTAANGGILEASITQGGHLEVGVRSPLFPFGAVHTEEANIIFQSDGIYGLSPEQLESANSGSATTLTETSLLKAKTGTTVSSEAKLRTRRRLRYRPGQGIVMRYTAAFTSPVVNSEQWAGLNNEENSIMVGYQNAVFGLIYRRHGAREIETLTITTGSSTAETITVTLGSVNYSVAVTNTASTVRTAYEIAQGSYGNWRAYQRASTVIFINEVTGNVTGTFSITATTAVGAFAETRAGVSPTETFIPQSEWNADKIDGTGYSAVTLDPTKLNIYQIGIQYLGAGIITLEVGTVSSDGEFSWSRAHTIRLPNTLIILNFSDPCFRFSLIAKSNGSTTDLTVSSASFCGIVEGKSFLQGPRFTYENTSTAVGPTNYRALLTVRNDASFNSRVSNVVSNVVSVFAAAEHNNPVAVYLIRNATLVGSPNFQQYSSASPTSIDVAATTVTFSDNRQIVWSGPIGGVGQVSAQFTDLITIQPGETMTLAARTSATTASYVRAAMNTREDQ